MIPFELPRERRGFQALMADTVLMSVLAMLGRNERDAAMYAALDDEGRAEFDRQKKAAEAAREAEQRRRAAEIQAAHDDAAAPFREARRLRQQRAAAKGCYGR